MRLKELLLQKCEVFNDNEDILLLFFTEKCRDVFVVHIQACPIQEHIVFQK